MTNKEWREKLLATWWGIARKVIGLENAWEFTHSLYPEKIQEFPWKGLTRLTIDELETVVKGLVNMSDGQYHMPKRKQKTRGQWQHYEELSDPATPRQMWEINQLADKMEMPDEYLIGVLNKATGGLNGRVMSRKDAQKVIEALKAILKRQPKVPLGKRKNEIQNFYLLPKCGNA